MTKRSAVALKNTPEPTPQPEAVPDGAPRKKTTATPKRRDAEAARRARLKPSLSPKEARKITRQAEMEQRQKSYTAADAAPERQLMRDVVDSRFNLGEIAMPVLIGLLAATLFPGFVQLLDIFLYISWAYILGMGIDSVFMWRRYKALAAERLPGVSIKRMFFYGFNRQLSFRRWRQPAARVKRGDKI